ncbi:MAG: DUF2334 domain-containing protein [Polyangiaceae bacterium]
MSWRMAGAATCLVALLGACGGGEAPANEALDESENLADITLERRWVLKSDGLTEGSETLGVELTLPKNYRWAKLEVEGADGAQVVEKNDAGVFAAAVPVAELEPGEHRVVVRSRSSNRVLGTATFVVSAALYVVVSTDWDDTRMSDAYLARMEGLRQGHPGLKITQFFAPFHYTDPQVSPARKQEIDAWIKEQRDQHGDEIGVHIHGWCHFIETTGVPCKTKETFYKDDGSGYTTILAAYSEPEMTAILAEAVRVFDDHGLGRPTSFRAGGWTASADTLRALATTGFTVDTSAVPADTWLASWKAYDLYSWTTTHWDGITETSQPYFPLGDNPAEPDPLRGIPVLEVPDNGVLVDYVRGEDMTMIYDLNHDGGPLEEPTLYQVGWHPPNFSGEYLARMEMALSHVDEHLFDKDLGPAVYVNISELTKVWR